MDNPLERRSFNMGWLIGIIDGEGCFTLCLRKMRKKVAYSPRIQITNSNIRIIQKAKEVLMAEGFTPYFYAQMSKTGRPYYRLEISGYKRIKRFLENFLSLFECRFAQADKLYEYIMARSKNGQWSPITEKEHTIAQELSDLNRPYLSESSETIRTTPLRRRYSPNLHESAS